MNETALTTKPVEDLLDLIIKSLALELTYRVILPKQESTSINGSIQPGNHLEIAFELTGPDAPLLTANDGELLHAIEHIAAKVLNLEPEQHDRISLDADNYKQNRDLGLQRAVALGIACVEQTGQPYAFPPMSSRERRILHLALQDSGLPTVSSGEPPRRFVVLYPRLAAASPAPAVRTHAIRNAFRPR